MNRILITLIVLLALASAGCSTLQKLPPITASEIDYKRTDPLGGTTVHAEEVVTDPATNTVRAKSITWEIIYPQWTVHLSAKDYVQAAPAK